MQTKSFGLVFLLGLVLSSCSEKGEGLTSAIHNSTWRLQSIEIGGRQTIIVPANEVYTIEFLTASTAKGRVHCNTYGAKYQLVPYGTISFRDVVSTEMACPQPSNEGEFGVALAKASSIELLPSELRLYYLDRTRVLHFIRLQ